VQAEFHDHPRCGIILQSQVWQNPRMTIFDRQAGKVCVRMTEKPHRCNWSTGSILQYTLRKKARIHDLENAVLCEQPLVACYDDILFVHHVLEILWAFLPDDDPHPDVYDWYIQLYQPDYRAMTYAQKIAWLCALFFKLGIYPPPTGSLYTFSYLVSLISRGQLSNVSDKSEGALEHLVVWLRQCLETHPAEYRFKTNHFLHKARDNDRD